MNSHLPVIIIGAGPTGLMMACELGRNGIPFRIFDKQPQPTQMANAAWIQTRTLEIFEHIGILDRFLRSGNKCNEIKLYLEGKPLATVPLNNIDSIHPYVLIIPQSETEKILNKRLEELRARVERPIELIGVKANNKVTEVMLRDSKGKIEKINCTWLIACDGANSTIRQLSSLNFPGKDIIEQFMVCDAEIESYMEKNAIHVFFDRESVFTAMPFGNDHYRVAANLNLGVARTLYTSKEAIELVQERAHGAYYVKEVNWVSPFWIHSKMLRTLCVNQVLFCGDAAHIHSPAGGQGMNLGLQDAYNLAWKLAMVVKNKAKITLIDSYEKERLPIIKTIVNETEMFTNLIIKDKSFISKLRAFGKAYLNKPNVKIKKMCNQITELSVQYKRSSIIDYSVKLDNKAPHQGARMPNVELSNNQKLYDLLRNTQHNILVFLSKNNPQNLTKIAELQSWSKTEGDNLIKVHVISPETLADVDNLIHDPQRLFATQLHIEGTAIYLVRPDTYIAYASHNLALNPVKKVFSKYAKIGER